MLGPKAVCHYFPPYWTSLGPYPTKKKNKTAQSSWNFSVKDPEVGKNPKKNSVQSTWTLESGAWLGQSECLLDPKIQFSFPLALESPEHNPSIQSQWSNCQPAVSKKNLKHALGTVTFVHGFQNCSSSKGRGQELIEACWFPCWMNCKKKSPITPSPLSQAIAKTELKCNNPNMHNLSAMFIGNEVIA